MIARLALVALVILATIASGASAAHAHQFGRTPYQDLLEQAWDFRNECGALTRKKLAALALAITWHEVTGGDVSKNPSPMTMGRADEDTDLYYSENPDGKHRRAFWHPGIGMWQLDDAGLGTYLTIGKYNTVFSSRQVVRELANRYCSDNSLSNVFNPWYACDSGRCADTYRQIYNGSSNELEHMSPDGSVGRFGGTQVRSCRYPGSSFTFTCYRVDWYNAGGYTANWTNNREGTPPLAKPYYIFRSVSNGTEYEWRVWMRQDTGYANSLGSRRNFGNNSRSGLVYSNNIGLCDVDRGVCA